MGGIGLVIRRHNWVVDNAALLVAVIAIVAAGRTAEFHRRHIVEVIVHGQHG